MEVGSIADWVAALSGSAAVVAAVVSWRISSKYFELEKKRELACQESSRRAQAELVFAVGAKLEDRAKSEQFSIYLVNSSFAPIYDVTVKSQRANCEGKNHDLVLGVLPPGNWVVPSHETYHWGGLEDVSKLSEPVALLTKGKGAQMVTSLEFTDAQRRCWRIQNGSKLEELRVDV